MALLRGQADAALAASTPAMFVPIHRTLNAAHAQIRVGLREARNVRTFVGSLPPGKK